MTVVPTVVGSAKLTALSNRLSTERKEALDSSHYIRKGYSRCCLFTLAVPFAKSEEGALEL